MARYIDAEKMQVNCLKDKKFVFAMDNPYTQEVIMEIVYRDFLDFLNEQPTADVEEVVRCKGCVFNVANMEKDPLDATDYSDITCSYFMTDGMTENDFCSYGKKVE